jgi:hypothetical protein
MQLSLSSNDGQKQYGQPPQEGMKRAMNAGGLHKALPMQNCGSQLLKSGPTREDLSLTSTDRKAWCALVHGASARSTTNTLRESCILQKK